MAYDTLSDSKKSDSKKPGPDPAPEDMLPTDPVEKTIEVGPDSANFTAHPARPGRAGSRGLMIGLGLGAAIAAGAMTLARSPQPVAKEAAVPAVAGQSVSVALAKLATVPKTISATGNVDSRDWAQVMPQATGLQILRILANEGDAVQAGQVIAELDNAVLQDQLSEARSQLISAQAKARSAQTQVTSAQSQLVSNQAQEASARSVVQQKQALLSQQQAVLAEANRNLERYQNLQQQGVISQQDLESRRTTATTARENVSVAQANIASAQADVNRAQAGISQAQAGISQAEAGVSQAQADVESARTRIQQLDTKTAQTLVRAPVSGILSKKNPTDSREVAKVGEITGSNPLFYILPDGSLELSARVPENLLAQVKVGATAKLTSPGEARITLTGKVREVTPVLNGQGLPIVKISLPPSTLLKPGMLLKADIVVQQSQAVTVPQKAVVMQADGRQVVYVVDQNQVAHAKPVEMGDISKGQAVIKQGLEPDAPVVVQGAGFVKDGDRVTVAGQ